MSDAGIFKTRQRVSVEMINQISDHCLTVRSDLDHKPFSFYGDRLLVAIDETFFDLKNTEDVAKHFTKAKARRSKAVKAKEAAFARVNVSCLLDLGLHNPLAVEVGSNKDSEVTLGNKLVDRIPVDCMLLAGRLYGNACFVDKLLSRFKGSSSAFVIRVGGSTTCQELVEGLADGSAIIRVPLRNRDRPATIDSYKITSELIDLAIAAAFDELKNETIAKRTNRSCPRTIRKNVIDWPKTKCYQPHYEQIKAKIIPI